MAYSTTLDQKRRETLRRQLYGKEVISPKKAKPAKSQNPENQSDAHTFSYTNAPERESSNLELLTANYLSRDLTRILIYSAIAVAIQITLFFAINNHLVKLPI